MTDITLSQLLKMAPMDEATKKEILEKIDTLNEDQKYRLSMVCWQALAQEYDLKLAQETDQILDEVREGKRKYNINDFTEAKAKQSIRFTEKVGQAQTQEDLTKVKEQLETLKHDVNPQTPNIGQNTPPLASDPTKGNQ